MTLCRSFNIAWIISSKADAETMSRIKKWNKTTKENFSRSSSLCFLLVSRKKCFLLFFVVQHAHSAVRCSQTAQMYRNRPHLLETISGYFAPTYILVNIHVKKIIEMNSAQSHCGHQRTITCSTNMSGQVLVMSPFNMASNECGHRTENDTWISRYIISSHILPGNFYLSFVHSYVRFVRWLRWCINLLWDQNYPFVDFLIQYREIQKINAQQIMPKSQLYCAHNLKRTIRLVIFLFLFFVICLVWNSNIFIFR